MSDTTLSFNILARDNASSTLTKVSQRFGDVNVGVGKLGNTVKSIGPALAGLATGFAALQVGGFLKDAIGQASDLGETMSKSSTVFGKSNAIIEKFAETSARSLGQSKQSAIGAAAQFGNMFTQLGIGQKPAAEMSTQMVRLASDFASFHNADITEVLEAQEAAFRGEFDSVQKFVPTINAAAVEQEALRLKLAGSTKELTAQDKAIATQSLLMKGAGKAVGDFARTSGGLANQQRILGAQFSDFKASIGSVALPYATKFFTFLNDTGIPAAYGVVSAFKGLGKRIVSAIGPVDVAGIGRSILEDATGWAKDLITGFKTGITKGDWKPLGTAIGDGITAAINALRTNSTKIIDALGAWVDSIDWSRLGGKLSNAFTGMLRAVDWKRVGSTLGDSLIEMIRKTADLGQKLGVAFKEVIDKVDWQKVGRDSSSAIGQFISGIDWPTLGKTLALSAVKSLKISADVRQSIINGISDVLIGAYHEVAEWGKKKAEEWGPMLWAGLKNGIVSGAKGIGAWLKTNFVDPIPAWTKKLLGIKSPSTVFAAIGLQVVAGFKGGIAGAVRGIGSWVYTTAIVPAVTPFLKAGTWLVQHGKNAVAGFKNGVRDVASGIGRWAYDNVIVPLVRPFNNKPGTWLVQQGKNVIAGFKNGMVSIWKDVTKWVSGIATWIRENKGPISLDGRLLIPAGQAIMSGFLKGLKSGAGPAWNFVKSVGGKTVDMLRGDMLNIPGIIPGALSGPNRRVFYQGEALDLGTYNKLAKAMKSVGGINVTQGSYERASSYSGSTHVGGGVFDVVGGNLNRILGALKSSGLIGWIRNPSQGPWPWHIHALDPSETGRMSASARAQVADYYRGGNGLAGFRNGGWLMPGMTAYNETNTPEPILNQSQWNTLARASRNGGGSTMDLTLRVAPGGDSALAQLVHKLVRTGVIQLSVGGNPVRVAGA